MLLNGGEGNGHRLLTPASVGRMTTNHLTAEQRAAIPPDPHPADAGLLDERGAHLNDSGHLRTSGPCYAHRFKLTAEELLSGARRVISQLSDRIVRPR
ncbi:hypothetical protein ACWC2T_36030 [Streptomyces sp. NPDC001393]